MQQKPNTAPNFQDPETLYINTDSVACDGGGGPLGHPRIYMTVDKDTHQATCGYCDRVFIKDETIAGRPARTAH